VVTDPTDTTHAALEARLCTERVPFDGGKLVWRQLGEGPPLVLLHGGHGSWRHWVRNIERLATRFSVWVPDLPGYGESDAPSAPTLDSLIDAIGQTLDRLVGAGTPIVLAGFSFGGLVASHLAARRGAVERLVLLGPAGHGGDRRPRGALQSWREALASGDAARLRTIMRGNLELHMLHGPADEAAIDIHTDACVRTRFHSRRISRAAGLREALRRLTGPVLAAWGEHDVTATPAVLMPALGAEFPALRTRLVAGAGHWVQYEAADEVNALLLAWCDQGEVGDRRPVTEPAMPLAPHRR
jgi:pimeloyl-ACP methyl ester carboxylesterase